jgi:7-cyano-7-deazaguanine reductase
MTTTLETSTTLAEPTLTEPTLAPGVNPAGKVNPVFSFPPEQIDFAPLEIWENKYTDRDTTIIINVPEFTSVCPKTGLPDIGTIIVEYIPDALVLELKAFKYYTLSYRNCGIFYENVVNKFRDDIIAAIAPRYLKISANFTPRGGITTAAVVEYHAKRD